MDSSSSCASSKPTTSWPSSPALSLPIQDPDGKAIIAGSLGDSFDDICPMTIRLHNAHGLLVVSVVTPNAYAVEPLDLPISQSNSLEEEGPPPTVGTQPEPAGPDRIKIIIKDPDDAKLCFAAIPKVFPLAAGYTIPTSKATKKPITMIETPTPTTDPRTPPASQDLVVSLIDSPITAPHSTNKPNPLTT
jgi:hypothetical protein